MNSTDRSSPVREGDIIADKYRVERVLGVGGMGVVVAALHVELDERVALKFLLPEAAASPSVAARFAQEARAAVKIKSEHVARVLDVGKLAGGAPFMVMEYMDGQDLEQLLQSHGPFSVDVAVGYVLEASEAIAEAHALGIVHRDLKPANLFLARRPSGPPVVKVLDFGISKSMDPKSNGGLTRTSSLLGSPAYMSPEQLTATKAVDARADIWALGAVLFQLLTGTLPFDGDSMPELVACILQNDAPLASTRRPNVPPGVDAVIERCLRKAPADRFADVAELARELSRWSPTVGAISLARIEHLASMASSAGGAATQRAGAAGYPTAGALATDSLSRSAGRVTARAAPRIAALAGVAVLALVVITAAVVLHGRPTVPTVGSPEVASGVGLGLRGEQTGAGGTEGPVDTPVIATAPAAPPTGAAAAAVTIDASADAKRANPPRSRPVPRTVVPVVDCDPPYTIDRATGHHVYKPECLRER